MTLATSTSREQYATNGQTVVWPVPFAFYDAEDLAVILSDADGKNPVMLTANADYLVEGGEGGTGALTCPAMGDAHAAGKLLTVTREMTLLQDLDLVNLDGFDAELVERQFDRSRMIDQQLQEQLDRCVKAPVTDPDALTFEDIQAERAAAALSADSAATSAATAANASAVATSARDAAEGYAAVLDPSQYASADHNHAGVYEPVNASIVKANAVFPLPTADLSATGIIIQRSCGETIGMPWLCRIGTNGYLYLADADAASTMPVRCVSLGSGVLNDVVSVLLLGFIRVDSWTWTPGLPIYASTDPGMWTQTAPSGTGDQVQIVGYALSATLVFVCPSLVVVEVK